MFYKLFFAFMMLLAPLGSRAASGVVINEVAWMGTKAAGAVGSSDEWIELYNSAAAEADLTGWQLYEAGGGTLIINLSGKISAGGYYLIERTDDTAIADVAADVFGPFGGNGLSNSGENLVLKDASGTVIDSVDASAGWPAGDNSTKASMERKADGAWQTNDGLTINGHDVQGNAILGTPRQANSAGAAPAAPEAPADSTDQTPAAGSSSALPLKAEIGGDVVAEIGQTVKFNGGASTGAKSYKWFLGDGAVKEGAEVEYVYQFPGTYLVTLEVSSDSQTAFDQAKAVIFGGKAVINEFFTGSAEGDGQWLELFNPTGGSLDISNWIISADADNFSLPPFVLIPPNGFLVLSQAVTGLDFRSASKIRLLYPGGVVVDEVGWEKTQLGLAGCRAGDEFFWSREPTPGRANVVLSAGAPLAAATVATASRIIWHPALKTANLLAAATANVSELSVLDSSGQSDNNENSSENKAVSGIIAFVENNLSRLWVWIFIVIVLGSLASLAYFKIINRLRP